MILAMNMQNREFITVRACNCHRVSTTYHHLGSLRLAISGEYV